MSFVVVVWLAKLKIFVAQFRESKEQAEGSSVTLTSVAEESKRGTKRECYDGITEKHPEP